MKKLSFLLVQSIFLHFIFCSNEEAENKVKTLLKLPQIFPNVYKFDNSTYWKYALKSPRPYQLLILFSTVDKNRCPECINVNNAFQKVAEAYKKVQLNNQLVIFTFLDLLDNLNLAQLHQINSIPYISSLTQKSLTRKGSLVIFKNEELLDPMDLSRYIDNEMTLSQKILDWINIKTNVKVKFDIKKTSKIPRILYLFIIIISALYLLIKLSKILVKFPFLVSLGGLFVFFFSISGTFYCLQHNSLFIGYNVINKKIDLISQQSRGQFILEGYLMSAVNVAFSMFLFKLIQLVKSDNLKNHSFKRYLYFLIMFSMAVGSLIIYYKVYIFKMTWPSFSFLPPSYYISGPLKNDRNTAF